MNSKLFSAYVISLMYFPLEIAAQFNIIPDPGFEYAKPNHSPQCEYGILSGPNSGLKVDMQYWESRDCSNWGCDYRRSSPDWMHPLCPSRITSYLYHDNFIYLEKRDGNNNQDAAGTSFIGSMQDNQWYLLKIIYIKVARKGGYPTIGDPRLKIYLTKYGFNWLASFGNQTYTITMYPPAFSNNHGWSEHWVCFTAANLSKLRNITLACENGAMYISHVEIYPICSDPLLIEDRKFYAGVDYLPIKSSGTIKAGYDVGAPGINGDVVIHNGASVTFKGVYFDFLNSFIVEPGGDFETLYEPCSISSPLRVQDSTYELIELISDLTDTIQCGDTIHLEGLDGDTLSYLSYQWDFGNGQTSTEKTVDIHYSNSGTYEVTLIIEDSLGRSDTLTKSYVVPACRLMYESPFSSDSNIVIFPNPSSGTIMVNIPESINILSYQVNDITSRIIRSGNFVQNPLEITIADKGVYYLQLYDKTDKIITRKILIVK